jgi:NTP pyrophosphatase (non-canonical NTP hydrolase)
MVHRTAVEKGWWEKPRNFGDIIALMHSELSEAYEAFRAGHAPNETWYVDGKQEGIPSELADVAIRLLDFCEAEGFSLEAAIIEKDAYNKTRPYHHGGKIA